MQNHLLCRTECTRFCLVTALYHTVCRFAERSVAAAADNHIIFAAVYPCGFGSVTSSFGNVYGGYISALFKTADYPYKLTGYSSFPETGFTISKAFILKFLRYNFLILYYTILTVGQLWRKNNTAQRFYRAVKYYFQSLIIDSVELPGTAFSRAYTASFSFIKPL